MELKVGMEVETVCIFLFPPSPPPSIATSEVLPIFKPTPPPILVATSPPRVVVTPPPGAVALSRCCCKCVAGAATVALLLLLLLLRLALLVTSVTVKEWLSSVVVEAIKASGIEVFKCSFRVSFDTFYFKI